MLSVITLLVLVTIPLAILFPHVRKRIKLSTLRHVPGPAPESFWTGTSNRPQTMRKGNLIQSSCA